ncbi:MAG: Hint domain-containing protein [Actinomycetota bacterium]|nr:Hint domain-containing protein [Actinomycetota bacterium]
MTIRIEAQPANLAGGFVCGDTKVALMDGHSLSIADLVEHLHRGVHHAVYAIQEDGSVQMARLLGARRMSHDMEVVEVTLDDGSVVHCTPTQAFLGADGQWVEARELHRGDALLTVVDPHLWTKGGLDPDLHARTDAQRHVVAVRPSPDRAVYTFDIDRANNLTHACGIILHD